MDTGQKIQLARKNAGKTQAQLGKMLNVSGAMIGQWENNQRKPKPETLVRIAEALGVSVADLWGDDNGDFIFNPKLMNALLRLKTAIVAIQDGELQYYYGTENKDKGVIEIAGSIIPLLYELNIKGQDEACRLILELTKEPKYQRKAPVKKPDPADPNTDTPATEKPPEGQNNPADGK